MQYAILFYGPQLPAGHEPSAAEQAEMKRVWGEYMGALGAAGVMRGGEALMPAHTASTVRLRDGRRQVQDGPMADSKEALGGFVVIEVPDLDAALDWAARSPSSLRGATEVRPVWVNPLG
jgi:hypothetical protein